jgi:hypothetical protein
MNILALGWVAFAVVWAIGFGSRAAWLARERRRDPNRWFLFGAVLGPAGLLILDDAPPGTCASCLGPVAGWSMTCVSCGEDVRTNARVAKLLGTKARNEPAISVEEPRPVTGVAVGPGRPATIPTALPAAGAAAEPTTASAGSPARRRRATTSPVASTGARPARAPHARPSPEAPAQSSSPTSPSTRMPEQVARDAAPIPIRPSRTPVAPQAASPSASPSDAPQQLDQLRRPVRLASCVFVEGNVKLLPGLWYQLTSEGDTLTITGQAGSIPNASAFSRSLSDVQVRTHGDELVLTAASDSGEELRLVFNSTLDWTPMGVTNEVEARRRAMRAG